MTALLIFFILAAVFLAASYVCYYFAFRRGRDRDFTKMTFPPESGYIKYADTLKSGLAFVRSRPSEPVSVTSSDGLRLAGRYYPTEGQRAVVLLFHGWRSLATNDFCCALDYLQSKKLGALLVDERAHGLSEGRTMTFGVLERYDVKTWCEWAQERFPGQGLIIEGISMGAATVMMATATNLPDAVRGVVADCGYTSPKDILCKVVRSAHAPVWLMWPLIRAGARIFGGFDPQGASALEAMSTCRLPVLFIHGEADDFVPCDMSRACFEACAAPWKKLVTVPGAEHGFSYVVDPAAVREALGELLEAAL